MKTIRLLLFALYLLVATVLSIYLEEVLFYFVEHFNTGWVFSSFFIRLLVIILFALGLRELFSIILRFNKMRFSLIFLIALLPGFFLSFSLSPIYQVDYGMFNDNQPFGKPSVLNAGTTKKAFTLTEDYNLIAFFTTTCSHCQSACKRIAATLDGDKKLSVHLIFPGNEEGIEYFLTKNNGKKFNYHLTDEVVFTDFSGYVFPSIFLVDREGNTLFHWIGDEMNYHALDYLNSLEF